MDGESGILWLVDGQERPFEPALERRRPWLEESTSWGASERDEKDEPASPPDESPTLVWL